MICGFCIDCSLIACLSRDLRGEFYPFFPRVLNALIGLLNPKKTELMDDVFNTLSYLFKFLASQLVDNIRDVFVYGIFVSYF